MKKLSLLDRRMVVEKLLKKWFGYDCLSHGFREDYRVETGYTLDSKEENVYEDRWHREIMNTIRKMDSQGLIYKRSIGTSGFRDFTNAKKIVRYFLTK